MNSISYGVMNPNINLYLKSISDRYEFLSGQEPRLDIHLSQLGYTEGPDKETHNAFN